VSADANAECDGLFARKLAPTGIFGVKENFFGHKKTAGLCGPAVFYVADAITSPGK
jgi:hypothetical protein